MKKALRYLAAAANCKTILTAESTTRRTNEFEVFQFKGATIVKIITDSHVEG